jgi:hypothetical protein
LVLNVAAVMRSLLFGQVAFFRVITEVIQWDFHLFYYCLKSE